MKFDSKKIIKRGILLIVVLVALCVLIANRLVKNYGFENIGDFYSNFQDNLKKADVGAVQNLRIEIGNEDFAYFEAKREESLQRGVQINIGDTYVPCVLKSGNNKIDAEIRLKGHMTDHLEGDKWSFRIKSDTEIFGMYRFSLQHPGTRNYAYEWVYHKLLANEDVIHLQYDFINVKLNDKDLGIYAIEEHFGQHVLEHNNRPKGAILRWNPGLYWEWRIDELQDTYIDEDYSSFSSSYAEPYDKGTVKDDLELMETYHEASRLLELFRRDSLVTSEVFDVEKMARFHAVIDLVGGYFSLDWSDIKFYYNSQSKRIEPVGYESFSVRKTESIAGQRIPDDYEGVEDDFHDKLFSDPIFFAKYIEAVERICDENYFNEFVNSIEAELDEKLSILAIEWPYRRFSFDAYYENIELIRRNLNLPKPFHAFVQNADDSLVTFSLAPVSDFPIEIISFTVNGKEEYKVTDVVIPAKARRTFVHYFEYTFPHHSKKIKDVVFQAKIPGGSTIFQVEVNDFPSYKSIEKSSLSSQKKETNINEMSNLIFSKEDDCYYFNREEIVISIPLELDSSSTLRLLPGQHLSFIEKGELKAYGQLEVYGSEENEVIISSSTSDPVISLFNSKALFSNVIFENGESIFTCFNSKVDFQSCVIADIGDCFLSCRKSEISIKKSSFGSVNCAVDADQSIVRFDKLKAAFGENFIKANGSYLTLRSSSINGYKTMALGDNMSTIALWGCDFNDNDLVVKLDNASRFETYGCNLGKAKNAYLLDSDSYSTTASSTMFYKTDTSHVNQMKYVL